MACTAFRQKLRQLAEFPKAMQLADSFIIFRVRADTTNNGCKVDKTSAPTKHRGNPAKVLARCSLSLLWRGVFVSMSAHEKARRPYQRKPGKSKRNAVGLPSHCRAPVCDLADIFRRKNGNHATPRGAGHRVTPPRSAPVANEMAFRPVTIGAFPRQRKGS